MLADHKVNVTEGEKLKTYLNLAKKLRLFVLFYGVSTLFELFNAELSHFDKSVTAN